MRSKESQITKKRKQSEDKIIRAIKERINRDIENSFEGEGKYYRKPARVIGVVVSNIKENWNRSKTL